jgi:hypothetical protein
MEKTPEQQLEELRKQELAELLLSEQELGQEFLDWCLDLTLNLSEN